MTHDPCRWLADSSANPQLVSLLSSAAAPLDLPVAVNARLGHTLQQLSHTGTTASTVAAAKTNVIYALATKPLLLVGAVATATLLTGLGVRQVTARHSIDFSNHAAIAAQGVARGKPQGIVQTSARPTEPQANAENPPETDSVVTTSAHAPKPKVSPIAVVSSQSRSSTKALASESTLAEEVRLLESVRAQLTTNPTAARLALNQYDARFPKGTLNEERTLLAVKLALAEGRPTDAQAHAASLEQTASSSPFAATARKILDSNERAAKSRTITK